MKVMIQKIPLIFNSKLEEEITPHLIMTTTKIIIPLTEEINNIPLTTTITNISIRETNTTITIEDTIIRDLHLLPKRKSSILEKTLRILMKNMIEKSDFYFFLFSLNLFFSFLTKIQNKILKNKEKK